MFEVLTDDSHDSTQIKRFILLELVLFELRSNEHSMVEPAH